KKLEVACASAARLSRINDRNAAKFRQSEGRRRGEAIAHRAAEGRVLTAGSKEMDVILQELAEPVLPPSRTLGIGVAIEPGPPGTVIMKSVGLVIVHRLVHPIDEPAASQRHVFEHVKQVT